MSEKDLSASAGCLAALVMFPFGTACGLYNAFLISLVYQWHIVPNGAPDLNYWHVYGAYILSGMVWSGGMNASIMSKLEDMNKDGSKKKVLNAFGRVIGRSLVLTYVTSVAYLAHLLAN